MYSMLMYLYFTFLLNYFQVATAIFDLIPEISSDLELTFAKFNFIELVR